MYTNGGECILQLVDGADEGGVHGEVCILSLWSSGLGGEGRWGKGGKDEYEKKEGKEGWMEREEEGSRALFFSAGRRREEMTRGGGGEGMIREGTDRTDRQVRQVRTGKGKKKRVLSRASPLPLTAPSLPPSVPRLHPFIWPVPTG